MIKLYATPELRKYRESLKMSQKTFAKMLREILDVDIKDAMYAKVETADRYVPIDQAQKISVSLNKSIFDFFEKRDE